MILLSQFSRRNPNVVYETGLEDEGIVLIKRGREKYILAHPLAKGSVEKRTNLKVETFSKARLLKEVRGEKVGIDFENASSKLLSILEKEAKGVRDVSDAYVRRRARKTTKEVALIKKAARIAEEVVLEMRGESEEEVRWSIVEAMARRKAVEAFPTIVANKENSRFPHHFPTGERVGEHMLIDRGARFSSYCSDMTDVLYPKGRAAKIYDDLQDIFYTIVDSLPSLETAGEVHSLYEKLYAKKKLKLPPHLIGHGVGIEVHESPRLYKDENFPLDRTVLAIEPSYYGRGFGLRFERMVHVRGRKARVL